MSFDGRRITLEAFAPDLTSPLITPQTATVGPGEEFSDISQFDLPGDGFIVINGDFDITDTTIAYTADDPRFDSFADVPDIDGFNGLVFTFDPADTRIAGVDLTLDDFGLPNDNIFFNANTIFLDFDGLPFENGDTGLLTVSFRDEAEDPLTELEDAIFTARLYAAAFGREPDQPGLDFWINAYDDVGRVGMSEFFLASPEFQDRFGDPVALSDGSYLDVLYNNILGRDGDEAGTAFWTEVLEDDLASRAEVLAYFVDSEENVGNTEGFENIGVSAANGEWFLLM